MPVPLFVGLLVEKDLGAMESMVVRKKAIVAIQQEMKWQNHTYQDRGLKTGRSD